MATANLSRMLEWASWRLPDKDALIFEEERWTYARLDADVNALAAGLLDLGIRRGEIVAILAMNCPEYILLCLAVSKIGAVFLPLNYRLHEEEVAYELEHSGAVYLASEAQYAPLCERLLGRLPALRGLLALRPPAGSDWADAHRLMDLQRGVRVPDAALGDDDLQRVLYTSGTTSHPKGALLTHGNVNANMDAQIVDLGLTASDRILNFGPLYHVGGLDIPGFTTFHVGATMVLMRAFDPPSILRLITSERITGMCMVQTMVHRLRDAAREGEYDTSSVRWMIFGQVAHALFEDTRRLFPTTRLIEGYGLTETCNGVAYLDEAHMFSKPGSVGRPLTRVDIRIVDDGGTPLAAGELGEIAVRGPKVCAGYLHDAEATRAAFREGWFHTGDIGHFDSDGYLYVVDRRKDMIRSGGENIASSEIEHVVYDHPAVGEAAVVALADVQWGEIPVLFVAAREGAHVDPEALLDHCRSRLGKFKVPKRVIVVDELPRNPSGKVLKRELRERLSALAAAGV